VETLERLDPLLIDAADAFNQETLRLHLERYRFAAKYAPGKVVVDCACGTSYGSELVAAEGGAARVYGCDLSEEAVAFGRARHAHPAVTLVVGDALQWTPPEAPDLWITLETVEHLPDPEAYLRRIRTLLKPGGTLIASVPTTVSTDGNPYHLVDFTERSFRRMLARTGFTPFDALPQAQRFKLSQVVGRKAAPRMTGEVRRNLLGYYLRHPATAFARAWLTLTRGFVNEYLTVAAK
jgi:trans-aconitate methyltransferase